MSIPAVERAFVDGQDLTGKGREQRTPYVSKTLLNPATHLLKELLDFMDASLL